MYSVSQKMKKNTEKKILKAKTNIVYSVEIWWLYLESGVTHYKIKYSFLLLKTLLMNFE